MRVIAEAGPPWVENDSQSGPCVHGWLEILMACLLRDFRASLD
jgi:hypothetical protein